MFQQCSVNGCEKFAQARGLCPMHYQRLRKHGDVSIALPLGKYPRPDLATRFWSKVIKRGPDDCWEWTAGKIPEGYGMFWSNDAGQNVGAHRIAYELLVGPIPDGMHLDHLCRVPKCVNPAHLQPVSVRENLMRGQSLAAYNAQKDACKHGHPFTTENTQMTPEGHRACRTCVRERMARWREANPDKASLAQRLNNERKRNKRHAG